jgi:hypothetical protein
MTDTVYRLLGPHHNRLVTVIESPQRHLGQISPKSADELKKQGWRPYAGTAQTKAGWITPGSDTNLRPRPLRVS